MKKLLLLAALFLGTMGAAAGTADDYVYGTLKVASDYNSADLTVNLKQSVEYVAYQMDITFPTGWKASDSNLKVGANQDNDTNPLVIAENWVSDNTLRIVCYNMGNIAFKGDAKDELLTVKITKTSGTAAKASDWTAKFSNVLFVTSTDLAEVTLDMKNEDGSTITDPGASTLIGNLDYVPGDINMDGNVDALDLTCLVSIILGDTNNPSYNYNAADVNADTEIDATDLTALVTLILN